MGRICPFESLAEKPANRFRGRQAAGDLGKRWRLICTTSRCGTYNILALDRKNQYKSSTQIDIAPKKSVLASGSFLATSEVLFLMNACSRCPALILGAMLSLLGLLGTQSACAQEATPQTPDPPYVSIGTVDGSPGASLIVPVYYTADPKTAIRSVTLELEFVSNNLEFQDATKGVVDEDRLEVSNTLTKGSPDSKGVTRSKLRLTATLKEDKSAEGLANGLIAYLMFQLSAEAKPFVITLTPTIIAAEDTEKPSKKVTSLKAQPGSISVLSADVTPEMSCFFFTH